MPYRLPDRYRPQPPAVYVEPGDDRHWQPDVYPLAAKLAMNEGAGTLVDLGCSTAGKLLEFHGEFRLIGVDLPGNLPQGDKGLWIGHDFDEVGRLSLGKAELDGAVLICSDVIEHLNHPERLTAKIRDALRWATAAVISTPDRERTRGPHDLGPPANPCHAREWTADEFVDFLCDERLGVEEQLWQRSHVGGPDATTVVVVR